MTIGEARLVIDAACQEWIRKGNKIAPGAFRIKKRKRACACALGCLPIFDKPDSRSKFDRVAEFLGIGFWNAINFASAFDCPLRDSQDDPRYGLPWHALGREFRAKYVEGAK